MVLLCLYWTKRHIPFKKNPNHSFSLSLSLLLLVSVASPSLPYLYKPQWLELKSIYSRDHSESENKWRVSADWLKSIKDISVHYGKRNIEFGLRYYIAVISCKHILQLLKALKRQQMCIFKALFENILGTALMQLKFQRTFIAMLWMKEEKSQSPWWW